MAAMTVTRVSGNTKVTAGPLAVSASDTLTASDIGTNGVLLRVNNGSGGSINVTVSDPGATSVGNAGSPAAQPVANGTAGWFKILPGNVNISTQQATVTYSGTTTVTYEAMPL